MRNDRAFMGNFSPDLQPAHFDVTFVISVVDHVPPESILAVSLSN